MGQPEAMGWLPYGTTVPAVSRIGKYCTKNCNGHFLQVSTTKCFGLRTSDRLLFKCSLRTASFGMLSDVHVQFVDAFDCSWTFRLRRLKKQAASPDSTAKFILDNDTLKDEDIKANEKLQSLGKVNIPFKKWEKEKIKSLSVVATGLSFHPEDEQITEPEELAIPDIISKIPGQYVYVHHPIICRGAR